MYSTFRHGLYSSIIVLAFKPNFAKILVAF